MRRFDSSREALEARRNVAVEILYGDEEGGQRVISRFGLVPRDDGWVAKSSRHWNIDRSDPR